MFFEIHILKTERCSTGKSLTRETFCGVYLCCVALHFSVHYLMLRNVNKVFFFI